MFQAVYSKKSMALSFYALTMLALPLQAQEETSADTADALGRPRVHELMPVEISAIRVNDASPFATSDLDKETIQSRNLGQDIPYILKHTPSVIVTSDGGAGVGYTGLRIRGTDISRINFTVNGIPVNDAESHTVVFVNFPDLLSSTGSIQVQRGVGSSTNGSGAFGASVNMSNLDQPEQAGAEWYSSFGSFNTWRNTLKASSGKLKGGFKFDMRLSKISSDGYIDRAFADLKALQFIAGWKSRDERTSLRFNVFTGTERTGQAWNGVSGDSLESNRRYNELGVKADGSYYDDQTDNYQQDYYQLFFDHTWNSAWQAQAALFLTRGKGFYNEYRLGQAYTDYGRLPLVNPEGDTLEATDLTRQLWLDNYYYGLTYSLQYKKNRTQAILGGSLSRYEGDHYGYVTWAEWGFPKDYRWYNLDALKDDFTVYGKLQQKLGRSWYVFGDLQLRKVHYAIHGFRDNPELQPVLDYLFFNPKLGLSYIRPHAGSGESKAYLSFAVANKEPNRDDFEAAPESLPVPETLYDLELGYLYKSRELELGLNAYYMYYRNQLVLTGKINDVGAYNRMNVDESYRTGLEFTGTYRPMPELSFQANATVSMNKILDFEEYIDDYDEGGQQVNRYEQTDIAFAPSLIGFGGITYAPFARRWDRQQLYVSLEAKHVGRQYLDNTSNAARSIDPYTVADLKFRYQMQGDRLKDLGITLALNNIFNTLYEANGYTFSYVADGRLHTSNYYYPQAGFNFMLGLQVRL